MTEKDFFRKALLAIASNSAFKPDYRNYIEEYAIRNWAKKVEQAATELLEVATAEHCGVDTEDVLKDAVVSDPDKPP